MSEYTASPLDTPATPTALTPPAQGLITWGQNVLERAVRQGLQAVAPILAVVVASGNGLDFGTTALAVGVAMALSVVKAFAGLTVDAEGPLWKQLAERSLSTTAATLLAFLPADWIDWASIDWSKALWASVAAGVLAVVMFYATPPAMAVPKDRKTAHNPS